MQGEETAFDRTTQDRRRAQHTYNYLSRKYDWLSISEAGFKTRAVRMLDIKPAEKVLEIGCGTGHLLLELASRAGTLGRVVGIDLSSGMIETARQRLEKSGAWPVVKLHLGDAASLPYSKGYFDAVLMTFVLELFDPSEIPIVLGECRRVLKPEGRMGVASLSLPDRRNLMTRAYEWFHRRFPKWVDCRPIPLRACLAEAGFSILDSWNGSMWGLPVEVTVGRLEAPPEQQNKIDDSDWDQNGQCDTEQRGQNPGEIGL